MDRPMVGVGNIIWNSGSVLLGKRTCKHANGMYGFPGGHLEMYESFEGAAIRETLEETGIEIPPDHIQTWTVKNTRFPEEGKHYAVVFTVSVWRPEFGHPVNREPDKCEGWLWCPWYKMLKPLMPGIVEIQQDFMHPMDDHNIRKMIVEKGPQ